ncbi:Acetyl-coenzyme A synthetase, cytoplasmic [Araneus ventricosus]|uniref:acetate--CoA ligase n=1 Tax=Araneus ventricosus TaxID=182803 RepID=A0A4Y2CYT2_ARAVE|nr:Acetyl-coenzyme A synthetase, cytoplasmic [Araneus ventricosus]
MTISQAVNQELLPKPFSPFLPLFGNSNNWFGVHFLVLLTDMFAFYWRCGSTGKPKGCVHTTGGYMIYGAISFKYVFDYHPGDVFFSTGDIGWLTGHTYTVYGPLLNTATCILHEGVPTHPDAKRYWEIVEKYGVTHFYTAPTVIRTLMRYDDACVTKFDRSSLRVLASVGEPINRDAWMWYHGVVGEGRCPIVDTYWQTESGGHLLTPMPFFTTLKPGCVALPFFGVKPAIVDDDGNEIKGPGKGNLVIKRPWPAIMRTIHGDHQRFENKYFTNFPGYYFTGDGGMRDEDGLFWVTGRVDDMLNVSGHLLSTTDVEASLMGHKNVAEIAVVSHPHPVKGECLYCFVVPKDVSTYQNISFQKLIIYKLLNGPSLSLVLAEKANVVNTSLTAFHLVFCSAQPDALTSLAMAAPSTATPDESEIILNQKLQNVLELKAQMKKLLADYLDLPESTILEASLDVIYTMEEEIEDLQVKFKILLTKHCKAHNADNVSMTVHKPI